MPPPARPKIYHIVHVDKLPSIVSDEYLWCDAEISRRQPIGTTIGMGNIKERRLALAIDCRPGLLVGDCVPFYFCPRSVMLFLLDRGNHSDLSYRGGQGPIIHLESDLHAVVDWAEREEMRWAFTLSNAGANYFEDRCSLDQLHEINWDAVAARQWSGRGISSTVKEGKQAEFLLEQRFPWKLVDRIGVLSQAVSDNVRQVIADANHQPTVEIRADWYY